MAPNIGIRLLRTHRIFNSKNLHFLANNLSPILLYVWQVSITCMRDITLVSWKSTLPLHLEGQSLLKEHPLEASLYDKQSALLECWEAQLQALCNLRKKTLHVTLPRWLLQGCFAYRYCYFCCTLLATIHHAHSDRMPFRVLWAVRTWLQGLWVCCVCLIIWFEVFHG